MDKCKCDLRTKLVGDGCQHCKPQITIDSLNDEIQTLRAEVASAEVLQFMNARANAIKGGNYYNGESERLAA